MPVSFKPVYKPTFTAQAAAPSPAAANYAPALPPVEQLLPYLGTQTRIGLNGLVQFNEPLVQQIAAYREQAIPPLHQFLRTATAIPVFLEGVYTADRLAEMKVRGVDTLYSAVSHWNSHPDPLIQIYLAGLYRKLNVPTSFGPLMATLVNRAVNQYPMQSSPTFNVTEEVGGAVLAQLTETISDRAAEKTVHRLMPYLQAYLQRSPKFQ